MSNIRKKVVVAMSGGVDSSVAAALLLREGYDVIGVFMRLGTPNGVEPHDADAGLASASGTDAQTCDSSGKNKQGCCSVLDAADARRVAGMLGVPFYVLNFQDDFGRVIDYFVAEYNAGRTPNPCVRCNDWLKFGKLAKYAQAIGADYVASGHYARIGADPATGHKCLMRGLDHRKDQSYVLFGMPRATIEHTLLPIGHFEKHEVRRIAEELALPVFNKPDSQEICFVPNQDYAGLVQRRSPDTVRPGQLVTTDGQVVGKHEGHQHFTIGQRKGVGVAFGYPIYVVDIDPSENRVVLGDKDALMKRTLTAHQINVLSPSLGGRGSVRAASPSPGTPGEGRGEGPSEGLPSPIPCTAKIRYNHQPQPATLQITGPDELKVTFDHPQSAITPGQAVVCYSGDTVLAGGWIDSAE
ncbi:MAG TPA: tRNA 2-thiouridine(34) synthase MnmA [Tepidisphaeraceae bacterium]|jgi:tRNA-specific 2-thiouridylase